MGRWDGGTVGHRVLSPTQTALRGGIQLESVLPAPTATVDVPLMIRCTESCLLGQITVRSSRTRIKALPAEDICRFSCVSILISSI